MVLVEIPSSQQIKANKRSRPIVIGSLMNMSHICWKSSKGGSVGKGFRFETPPDRQIPLRYSEQKNRVISSGPKGLWPMLFRSGRNFESKWYESPLSVHISEREACSLPSLQLQNLQQTAMLPAIFLLITKTIFGEKNETSIESNQT